MKQTPYKDKDTIQKYLSDYKSNQYKKYTRIKEYELPIEEVFKENDKKERFY